MKDPQDKNHYIPNPETEWVVKKIFKMLTHMLPVDVAQWLNDNNIPVPSESVGNRHTRTANEIKRLWNRTTVVRIARDKTYLGYVISGKTKKLSYKSKKIIQIPKDEQIIVEGKHEPLIDEETFDIVQKMIDSRRSTRKYKYDFLFKGLLECEECGKKLSILTHKLKNGKIRQYLRCNTYAAMTRLKLCTPHSSNYEKISNQILETIRKRLKDYLDEDALYGVANTIKNKQSYRTNMIQSQINTLKSKLNIYERKIEQLYEDRLNGILQVEDFERMYLSTLNSKKEVMAIIEDLETQKGNNDDEMKMKEIIKEFMSMKNITREMLVMLIDKITVSEDKRITIYYKFNVLNNSINETKKITQIKCS